MKKVLEYLRFSVLTSNQPVAQAEKNSTALPCGTPRRCRWYSGHAENQKVTVIPSREDSYERLAEMDIQFAGEAPGPEEQVLRHMESEQLHKALSLLSDADQYLIWQIYFEERTERDLSEELGCSQNAVNKRKQRILEKMRCFLEKL